MKRKEIVILAVVIVVVIAGGLLFRQVHTDSLYGLKVAGDGAGGAMAIYEDGLGGNIYAQKISPEGKLLWGEKGVLVGENEGGFQTYPFMDISRTDSGGAIARWPEFPSSTPRSFVISHMVILNSSGQIIYQGAIEDFTPLSELYGEIDRFKLSDIPEENDRIKDIRVQNPDSGWPAEGVYLGIDKAGGKPLPDDDLAVSDGSGGAIISWRDLRQQTTDHVNIFAQRVDRTGNLLWKAGGENVSATALNPRSSMVGDGYGGAVIAYAFTEDGGNPKGLHIQRLDARGGTLWPENGLVITDGVYASQDLASDGQGGMIVGWGVARGMFHGEQAYIQRISPDGRLLWGEGGIRLK